MKKPIISLLVSSVLLAGCGSQQMIVMPQTVPQTVPQQAPKFVPPVTAMQQAPRQQARPVPQSNPIMQQPVTNVQPPVKSATVPVTTTPVINNAPAVNKVIIAENYNTQSILAGLNSSADISKVNEIAAKYNLKVDKVINGINTVVFSTNGQNVPNLINELSKESLFSFVETDNVSSNKPESESDVIDSLFSILSTDPVNDKYFKDQYGLAAINAPAAWDINKGDNVIISVIDSGVDVDHADLENRVVSGYDAFSKDAGKDAGDASGLNYIFSSYKHGSHVAGIVSSEANNKKGIAGVAPNAKIMPVKIFPDFSDFFKTSKKNEDGSEVTVVSAIADGIVWSVDNKADVINLSLAVWEPSNTIERAVTYAIENNVTVVVAAGNERHLDNRKNHLAAVNGVIAVGATDKDNKLTYFSNAGDYVTVVAPGHDIISTVPSFLNIKSYRKMSGTSMAAPHVAGLAALLRSKFGAVATPEWIKNRIQESATDLGAPGRDDFYGHGLINAQKALEE